jgi:hypothetical protein
VCETIGIKIPVLASRALPDADTRERVSPPDQLER